MRSSPAASAAERRRAFKEGHRRHLSLRDKWCSHSGCRFATPLDSPQGVAMRPGPAGRNPKRSRLRRRRLPGPAPAAVLDLPRCTRRGFHWNCRPWAARITCAFRRAPRVPFRTDEKEPKVRLRTLRRVLRNLREYLAMTRELLPLPAGTPAEGSIQVADAPNNAHRMARRGPAAENNARSGRSRALRACAA